MSICEIKSKMYLELKESSNFSLKPVFNSISVLASTLSALKELKIIVSSRSVILISCEIVVIILIASNISFFGSVIECLIVEGTIL